MNQSVNSRKKPMKFKMKALRVAGMKLAIDDFGAG